MSVCGIDEAGRGPLAGPLVLAGAVLRQPIEGLNDSKKLTPKKREELFVRIIQNSEYRILFFSNKQIDAHGLSMLLRRGLWHIRCCLEARQHLFDGNCTYNVPDIECIIKGDSKIEAIKAASILAKVARDRYMCSLPARYAHYRFHTHKGYGTKEHRALIQKHGPSPLHRKSFRSAGTLF